MELLNHFVAARLMKDVKLFERIGQPDAARNVHGRSQAPSDRETKRRRPTTLWTQAPGETGKGALAGHSAQRRAR